MLKGNLSLFSFAYDELELGTQEQRFLKTQFRQLDA
jgi:hypothetical protein